MEQGFATLHPRLCLAYFAVVILVSTMMKHPVYLLFSHLTILLLNISIDGGKALKKSLKSALLIAAVIFVLNPAFSHRGATILGYVLDRPITLESIVYGALLSLSLLNMLFAFVAFNLIITPAKFLYLLTPYVPRTAFILTVTLRFMPLLTRRLKAIMIVQTILGYIHPQANKRQMMREGMETLHTLITWSLEEALQTAKSMRARGYGIARRSSAVVYEMDRRDYVVMWLMIVTGIHILVGALYGVNQYEIYPNIPTLEWSYPIVVHLGCFLIFLLIPVVMNGKEWLHWRIIRSRM